jgi:catechol 2,3-dioxygenase-like lactoylglutathione lyase family enzyme
MRIKSLDHLVLTVRNLEKSIDFYTRVLGMELVTFVSNGRPRKALKFGSQKLNLHETSQVLDKNVRHAAAGSADLCLLIEGELDDAIAELLRHHVEIIAGPVQCTGAMQKIRSVYVYDPDENLIELSQPV